MFKSVKILLIMTCFFGSVSDVFAKSVSHPNKPHRVSFDIQIDEMKSNLKTLSLMVMPNEMIRIQSKGALTAETGFVDFTGDVWEWTAPSEPGVSKIILSYKAEEIHLNALILTPFDSSREDGLGRFKIGPYQQSLFKGRESYGAPQGFIAVTEDMKSLKISPHFTLGQFLCKQNEDNGVSYALVDSHMLMKLERLLEVVNDAGHPASSFHIMSGFRTPWYNASIGNKTSVSRHLYGDGVDIFIDEDGDNYMDDLNGDGVSNKADAQILYSLASLLSVENIDDWKDGGLSIYKEKPHRGPFIHIDARGYQARW